MSNEWQYKALRGLSKTICHLPYSAVVKLGASLGPVYAKAASKQKMRAIQNIKIGMNMNDQEAEALADKLFRNVGRSALEILYMPKLTPEFIHKHIEVRGKEYIEAALAEQHGVVILTAHVGNWEWMGATLAALGYPSTTLVKKQPNAQFTRLINEYREHAGLEVFARGGSEILRAMKAMKQKKLLGFLADQDGGFHGLPVTFLGQESSAVLGPATFAQKFKAPVVPVFASRKPNGHIVHILPPLYYKDTGNEEEDLYRLTEATVRITESFIREHPDEWLWFQHRWNTRLAEIIDIDHKLAVREAVHAADNKR